MHNSLRKMRVIPVGASSGFCLPYDDAPTACRSTASLSAIILQQTWELYYSDWGPAIGGRDEKHEQYVSVAGENHGEHVGNLQAPVGFDRDGILVTISGQPVSHTLIQRPR
jgi:hypothetical protein